MQVVVTAKDRALLREVHEHFLPNKLLLKPDAFLEERIPELREMKPREGKATAYVCENFACQAPVNDPEELRRLLPA